jgi:nucleotide-binding universal stress UspA family protein
MTDLQEVPPDESMNPAAQYRVIACSDLSELGDRVVLEALRLCAVRPGAALHVITVGAESAYGVCLPGSEMRILPNEEAAELARLRVARVVDDYVSREPLPALDKIAVYVTVGAAAERIVALATAVDADLIVLGTHGSRGFSRFILGSVAEAVVKRADCGVFVIRPRDFSKGEKVPAVEPPLAPGEHALLPFRASTTYHYIDRMSGGTTRLMPSI